MLCGGRGSIQACDKALLGPDKRHQPAPSNGEGGACVCVCVCERERERQHVFALIYVYICVYLCEFCVYKGEEAPTDPP